MKKTIETAALATFSLADFPSGERAKMEGDIIEHALAVWRKKQRGHLAGLNALLQTKRKAATF